MHNEAENVSWEMLAAEEEEDQDQDQDQEKGQDQDQDQPSLRAVPEGNALVVAT